MKEPFFVLVPIVIWVLLCFAVGKAAAAYRRPAGAWFLLALLLSPLVAFAFLLVAGDGEQAAALREKEERIRRLHPDRKDIHEAALNETHCPHCGASINPVT